MACILVVDDEPANRDLVLVLVRHLGHEGLEASSGAQGLSLVRSARPELVISDVLMPQMDGYEFVRRVRADPEIATTKVVFYSAHYREAEARELALACGVHQVLAKPCEPQEIINAIEHALAQQPQASASPGAREFERRHFRLVSDKLSEKLEDLQRANHRLGALNELNLLLASEHDTAALLTKVCRGARELIGARLALLAVRSRASEPWRLAACDASGDRPWPDTSGELVNAPAVQVVRTQRELLHLDCTRDHPVKAGLPAGFPAFGQCLIAPVVSLTECYGWLFVANQAGEPDFNDEDTQLLRTLCAQFGRVFENAILLDTVRDKTAQMQALSHRVLQAQETERRRIACELHDELGQALTAVKINLQAQQRFPGLDPAATVQQNLKIVDDALGQVRRMALSLRPSILDDLGLVSALQWRIQQHSGHAEFSIDLQVSGLGEDRLAPDIEIAAFRIAQECLTNIARHARATRVTISLRREGSDMVMEVMDNGQGFNVDGMRQRATGGASLGVLGMGERAALVGGSLDIRSEAGHGSIVVLRCPWRLSERQEA